MPTNNYQNSAASYALRGLTGTDLLAFRAIAERIGELQLADKRALDLGCGSGRSTRFLKDLGLDATGVDVSGAMISEARRLDPACVYVEASPGEPLPFPDQAFDLFLASWVVLEQDTLAALHSLLSESARILAAGGRGLIVTNTPEFYRHRWISCDVDFPENQPPLVSGQQVKACLLPEGVVVTDVFWTDEDYHHAIRQAGLAVVATHHPQAHHAEDGWLDETKVAPWAIYEVQREQ